MKSAKNSVIHWLYVHILKHIFFLVDPEDMHDQMTWVGEKLGGAGFTRKLTGFLFDYSNPMLEQTVVGIKFKNPIGLAAGFDKDARLTQILPYVGFGFEEIGSITGEPCEGNPKPRLWRLPKSQALIIYYGLKNNGAEEISKRLAEKKFAFPIGTSVAKTNSAATASDEAAITDYLKAYLLLSNIGSYTTINISCPNAFGGQPFTDPKKLGQLLLEISRLPKTKPIFIKMPPDISTENVDQIIELARRFKIDGFICTNLTKDRIEPSIKAMIKEPLPTDKGGISGKVVEKLSDDLIRYIYAKTRGEFVIIGCGGIFSVEDAYRKIRLGASLLQLITGMIFEGPQLIGEINLGLVRLLERDGFKNISEAVGVDNRL
jgi:dihydroorotate dehydrogenase